MTPPLRKPFLDLAAGCFIIWLHLDFDEGFTGLIQFSWTTWPGAVLDRSGKFHFVDYSCNTWITDSETFKTQLLENCDRLKTTFSKSLNSFTCIIGYLHHDCLLSNDCYGRSYQIKATQVAMLMRPSIVVRATHKNFIVSLKASREKLEKQYIVHHQQTCERSFENANCSSKIRVKLRYTWRKVERLFKRSFANIIDISKMLKQYQSQKFTSNLFKFRFHWKFTFRHFSSIHGNSLKFALITFVQYCTSTNWGH